MKPILILIVALCAPLTSMAAESRENLTQLLQTGLFEEEANQDIQAAIQIYEEVVDAVDQQRRLAATAVFRLGECYRKLGQNERASEQYTRLIREFGGEERLAQLSRQNLRGMGFSDESSGTVQTLTSSESTSPYVGLTEAGRQEMRRLLEEELALAENELKSARVQSSAGVGSRSQVSDAQKEVIRVQKELVMLNNPAPQKKTDLVVYTIQPDDTLSSVLRQHNQKYNLNLSTEDLIAANPGLDDSRLQVGQSLSIPVGRDMAISRQVVFTPEDLELKRIKDLVTHSPDLINEADKEGKTPLHQAVEQGHLRVVDYLINHGADVNAATAWITLADFLFSGSFYAEHGKQMGLWDSNHPFHRSSVRDVFQITPLHLAAYQGNIAIINRLIDAGAIINGSGHSPLHLACGKGYLIAAKTLLDRGADVNHLVQSDVLMQSALHFAVRAKDKALVELLINAGADVDAGKEKQVSTPLFHAVDLGEIEIAQLLLKAGAEVNLQDQKHVCWLRYHGSNRLKHGKLTALHLAAGRNNSELVSLLLDQGAETNALDDKGVNPLNWLFAHNNEPNIEVAKRLLDAGAKPETANTSGLNNLEQAIVKSADECVDLLLDYGVDPNTAMRNGLPALHRSILISIESRLEILSHLIDHGADVNRLFEGEAPIHYAINRGVEDVEVVKLLLENGADPKAVDGQGRSPLMILEGSVSGGVHSGSVNVTIAGGGNLPPQPSHYFTEGTTVWAKGNLPPQPSTDASLPPATQAIRDLLLEHGATPKVEPEGSGPNTR